MLSEIEKLRIFKKGNAQSYAFALQFNAQHYALIV